MTARRKALMHFFAAVLEADRDARGGSFERNRLDPHRPSSLPARVLWDGGHDVLDVDTGGAQRALNVDVDLFVTADDGAGLGDAVADEAAAVTKVMLADLTCGGLAWEVREVAMTDPEFSTEGHKLVAEFSLRFLATYETDASDPSPPS